jgi:dihydrofolate reductase
VDFARVWPGRPESPFTPWLNATPKYVVSRTLHEPLPWVNSTLLREDLATAVARLKGEVEKDVLILGSGELIQSLVRIDAVDEHVLLIHPLVLGSGRRLFVDGGAEAKLRLVSSDPTPNGVIVATYRAGI